MAHFESKLSSEEIFRGRILRVTVDRVALEDGSVSRREIVRHSGGAAVLALDGDRNAAVVRQFRYAYGRELLEIPAGKLEPGEDPQAAALRELEEECGLRAGRVISLGQIYPSVGYTDEIIHLFLAVSLTEIPRRPDEGEFLTALRMPLDRLYEMVLAGTIRDAKTVAAVLKAKALGY